MATSKKKVSKKEIVEGTKRLKKFSKQVEEAETKAKKKKKVPKGDDGHVPQSNKRIIEVHLEDKANEEYYKYGTAVIEDRAIFGTDGLKPVVRRALWATHKEGLRHTAKADKAAKVVGKTLGDYHPHGDTACYGALVTSAKSPINLIIGEGNWGTMNDPPAAYRYTNMKLSKYSDLVFFDKFYLPTVDYIPNYDDSKVEPVILPSLLPNSILNGNFGITPGVQTRTPSFSLKSVIDVVREAIKAGECTPKMCMPLVFTTKYGGHAVVNKEEFLRFYKTGKGKVTFNSVHGGPDSKNEIRFDAFAPITDVEKTLIKVDGIPGVAASRDDGDKNDRYQVAYAIAFVKTCKGEALKHAIKKVENAFSASWGFSVQITEREKLPDGSLKVRLKPTTVPKIIWEWIEYRVALEVRACSYWMEERMKEIAHQELLRKAIKMIDFLFKAVKSKGSREDYYKFIQKGMKITFDEAKVVGHLQLVSLRSMEDADLVAKIKALKAEYDTYEVRKKNPKKYILSNLDMLEKEFAADDVKKQSKLDDGKKKAKNPKK